VARLPIAVRRLEILEGAMVALKTRGLADLRIKDIADASGTSTATIHYHFADLGELLLSVHDLASDRFARARVELLATTADARDKLRLLAATGLPADEHDALVSSLYELHSLHRRYPTHKRLVKALFDQQVDLYASVLEIGVAQGHFVLHRPARDLASLAVALEDAFGLHITSESGSITVENAHRLLHVFLAESTGWDGILGNAS